MRKNADARWRRSAMITRHIDHPPQVKVLVDELYLRLQATNPPGYQALIEAEYASAGDDVSRERCGRGYVSKFLARAHGSAPRHLTHLVYGGCTDHEIRQDLVARGWGSLAMTWVYPSNAEPADDDDLAEA